MTEKKKPDTFAQVSEPATTRDSILADEEFDDKNSPKCRCFATVIYPESAPTNWKDILNELHVEVLVSPLHDRDVNPTGELKKPHRHVQIIFPNPRSRLQARRIFEKIGGVGCESVNATRGMARYLCHLDNPEKAQYNPADVIELGGADYQEIISLPSDKFGVIRELIQFIELNNIYSFNALLNWCSEHNEQWFRGLCDNCAYIIREYIASRQYCRMNAISTNTEDWSTTAEEKARRLLSRADTEEDETDA